MAQALWTLAQSHCQQDPTFRTALSYTRLSVVAALDRLRAQGFPEDCLPSPSTMVQVMNRNSYHLRKVAKAKPQKTPRSECHLCPYRRQGRKAHSGPSVFGRWAGHAPEHRLQGHCEDRGILMGWENSR